jgi:hypothetical protein
MNAVVYIDQSAGVFMLSQSPKRICRTRCYWVSALRARRPKSASVVYRSVKRAAAKPRVTFTSKPDAAPHPWVAKIRSFARLVPGWNGGRAPAPTLPAIANTVRFLLAMTEAGYRPTRVAPSAVGGVGVTRRVGDRKALVEFFNNGSANALFADDATQQMQTHHVAVTPQGFRDILGKMREYLDG